jgi:hypothetical protein
MGGIMARVVAEYRGCTVELSSEGKSGAWRYSVRVSRQSRGRIAFDPPQALADVGPFESSAAAYQDAVRRINLLLAETWEYAL